MSWLVAFTVTQFVEGPILAYGATRDGPTRPLATRWAIALGASALTHPFVYYGLRTVHLGPPSARTLVAELLAIAIEAAWLRAFGVKNAVRWSLVANAASEGLGTLGWLAWTSWGAG